MALEDILVTLLIKFLIILVSAIPLFIAISLLGSKASFLKTALVSFLAGLIVTAIEFTFTSYGAFIALIVLIWIYREMFRLKWWKAFVAWLLQMVFIILFQVLAALVFGITVGITHIAFLA